jgi:hypothetical protein
MWSPNTNHPDDSPVVANMPRLKSQRETMTIGELAIRWGIDRSYARDLANQEEM